MTVTVKGPNGITIRFPDGTDQTTIDNAMRQATGTAPIATAAEPSVSVGEDLLRTVPSKLGEGTVKLPGLPGDLSDLAIRGVDWLTGREAPAGMDYDEFVKSRRWLPTSKEVSGAYEDVTGVDFYEPQTNMGKIVGAGAELVPGGITLAGGLLRSARQGGRALMNRVGQNAIQYGLAPGMLSEGGGQATKGTGLEPYARLAGALLGSVGPTKAITPFPASSARQRAVQVLRNEGIDDLTAGQVTGSQKLKYMESELGGVRFEALNESQLRQFTRAVLRRIGLNSDDASQQVLATARRDIGSGFDLLASRNQIVVDNRFMGDLVNTIQDYAALGPSQEQLNAIRTAAQDIGRVIGPRGEITGQAYQAMRSRFEALGRSSAANPQFASAIRQIRASLDDAMERTMAATGSPDLGAWRETRHQYDNLLTVESAAGAAGEASGLGLITPQALRGAVTSRTAGRRDYALGRGDFAELANAGEAVMRPMPQSGTAPRAAARAVPMLAGALLGNAAGPIGSAGGVVAGMVAPWLTGRALLSGPVQRYLGNQLLAPEPTSITGLSQALIQSGGGQIPPPVPGVRPALPAP